MTGMMTAIADATGFQAQALLPRRNGGTSSSAGSMRQYDRVARVELPDTVSLDKARFESVKQAATRYAEANFAVSDTRFTIFKDSQGQYITRFTSLRDGSVRYYPEDYLLKATFGANVELTRFSAEV